MRGRIRTIKPEAFTDEDLWDLEVESGLPIFRGFVGLWTQADREGRFEWRPRALKLATVPYWDGDFSRVLDALTTRGFVVKYECEGREYGLVRSFAKHQVVNNREQASDIPPPPDSPAIPPTPTRGRRVDDACPTPLVHALVEGKGTEGKESVDGAAPPPGPAIEERIERLAARYPSKLLEAVHAACRLSRTTGKMSDSKWLAALESFAVYDVAIAVRAMEVFADRYADGTKNERYLLGIMRGERDQPAQRGLSLAAPVATREDAPDWHPTHGAPKSARNFDTWEAWINDGCPRDPAWKVAS